MEEYPQGVKVRPLVHGPVQPAGLLGRQVGKHLPHHPRIVKGQAPVRHPGRGAETQKPDFPVGAHQNGPGPEGLVDKAPVMGVAQGFGHGQGQREELLDSQGPASRAAVPGNPRKVLQDKDGPVIPFSHVKKTQDAGGMDFFQGLPGLEWVTLRQVGPRPGSPRSPRP
jgi:hypothetical protein